MITLTPYRPYLRRQGSRGQGLLSDPFFRSFFSGEDLFPAQSFRVDIHEKDDAYILDAELPGVPEENISLVVNDDALTISADIESEHKDEQGGYSYCERRTGHVERSFSLDGIAQDLISATYEHGILRVQLPKAQPKPRETTRKIAINKPILPETEAEQPQA